MGIQVDTMRYAPTKRRFEFAGFIETFKINPGEFIGDGFALRSG